LGFVGRAQLTDYFDRLRRLLADPARLERQPARPPRRGDRARRRRADPHLGLCLLGSALGFEDAEITVHQVLAARGDAPHRLPLDRRSLLRPRATPAAASTPVAA
jgi:hypothetical protein